jgi:hypothetical protein
LAIELSPLCYRKSSSKFSVRPNGQCSSRIELKLAMKHSIRSRMNPGCSQFLKQIQAAVLVFDVFPQAVSSAYLHLLHWHLRNRLESTGRPSRQQSSRKFHRAPLQTCRQRIYHLFPHRYAIEGEGNGLPQFLSSSSRRSNFWVGFFFEALVGLNFTQFAEFGRKACAGLAPEQVPFIEPITFVGLNAACAAALPAASWWNVSATQLGNVTNTVFGSFTPDIFLRLNPASLAGLGGEDGAAIDISICKVFTETTMFSLSYNFLLSAPMDCFKYIPAEAFTGVNVGVISAVAFHARAISDAQWARIPLSSISGIDQLQGGRALCRLFTPQQITYAPVHVLYSRSPLILYLFRFVKPFAFISALGGCAETFRSDVWPLLSAAQVANASSSFFTLINFDKIILLSNETIQAITYDQWRATMSDPSVVSPSSLVRLLRLVGETITKPGLRISTPSPNADFGAIAEQFNKLNQTDPIFFLSLNGRSDWDKLTWMHFLVLNCYTPGRNPDLSGKWSDLQSSLYQPLSGLRSACVPTLLPTLESFSTIPSTIVGQIPVPTFLSFTASEINMMQGLVSANMSVWAQLPPSTISGLSLATWNALPINSVQQLTCDQCKAVDPGVISQVKKDATMFTLEESFRISFSRCGLWGDSGDMKWIIIGCVAGGGFLLVVVIAFVVYILKNRKSTSINSGEKAPLLQ